MIFTVGGDIDLVFVPLSITVVVELLHETFEI